MTLTPTAPQGAGEPEAPPASWRTLPLQVAGARALLDEGVRLLENLANEPLPVLRWYIATHTTIVLGRGQARDLHAASTAEVEVLTRFSGGGAVLMDRDLLTLDVLLPADHPLLDGDLGAVFLRIGTAWAQALSELGVPDVAVHRDAGTARRRGDDRERLLAAVCYATIGRGEVLAGGRKLLGLAQRRRRTGALVQCGLLRRWTPGPLLRALGAPSQDPEIEAAAVGLDDLSIPGGPVSNEAVMAAVERRLATAMRG
ncbi:MAG: hypothetical protein GEU81_15505 [Nitriliruptorales bacterium]|nr:hypothetical protein [Nitriliruptorales bacterium]